MNYDANCSDAILFNDRLKFNRWDEKERMFFFIFQMNVWLIPDQFYLEKIDGGF